MNGGARIPERSERRIDRPDSQIPDARFGSVYLRDMVRYWPAFVLVIAASVGACKKSTPPPMPDALCSAEVLATRAAEVQSQSLTPELWYSILLANFDREHKETRGPAKNCVGEPIAIATFAEEKHCSKQPRFAGQELAAARGLDSTRLVEAALESGRSLIWVQTHVDANNDAIGPIAKIEWHDRGVLIKALGTLEAHRNRAQMRIVPGSAAPLLAVESERCDPQSRECNRELRILVQAGDRFIDLPLVDDAGTCQGPAKMLLKETHTVPVDAQTHRLFTIVRSLQESPTGPLIQEQLTIENFDPRQPELPKQLFRKADLQRKINVYSEYIQVPPGLWERTQSDRGNVRPEQPKSD